MMTKKEAIDIFFKIIWDIDMKYTTLLVRAALVKYANFWWYYVNFQWAFRFTNVMIISVRNTLLLKLYVIRRKLHNLRILKAKSYYIWALPTAQAAITL